MTGPTPHSDEVETAVRKERKRIEVLTEARILRDQLAGLIANMQDTLDKYDADPENEGEAVVLIVMPALLCHSFMAQASAAARRMKENLE